MGQVLRFVWQNLRVSPAHHLIAPYVVVGTQTPAASFIFFIGQTVASGTTSPGWGLQRSGAGAKDGPLALVQISSSGGVTRSPLSSSLLLHSWTYLSVVLSRLDSTSNRTEISIFLNSRLNSSITIGMFGRHNGRFLLTIRRCSPLELHSAWDQSSRQTVFLGGAPGVASASFFGSVFRLGVWATGAGTPEFAESMRGVRPSAIEENISHLWTMSEGSGSVVDDSVTGAIAGLPPSASWGRLDDCGDGTLQDWEQCDAGRNCTSLCTCAPGSTMTFPPSASCYSALVVDPPTTDAPSLDGDSQQYTGKILIVVWAIAILGVGAYFLASKYWRRFLPPKVPTAVIVRVGTEQDLRILESGGRMDEKRAAELMESDAQSAPALYQDLDEEILASKIPPGSMAKSWSSDVDTAVEREIHDQAFRSVSVPSSSPTLPRRFLDDISDDGITLSRFGDPGDEEDDLNAQIERQVKSAPVSPVSRKKLSYSDDDII